MECPMADFLQKLKDLILRRPPHCPQCKRDETRSEWVKKKQCSMCYGPLMTARERDES